MNKERSKLRAIAERLNLPSELLPEQTMLYISGKREVTVTGHHGIQVYTREQIQVRVSYGLVLIEGQGLEIARMNAQSVVVRGSIGQVALEGRA